ncbi:MAG: 16S rRNA (guanine(527)-N(7))-methyltransferase RsmG [Victivallaceae bacterium]|nr:16S rRNA (guanine(527)-N(7))-methyltransferase RsmG [Victivallaceae bacterium]
MKPTVPFELKQLAVNCGVNAPERFVETCDKLESLLSETNSHTNLTRICGHDDFLNKHVADSLLIAKYFPALTHEKTAIADIGCGAGFPSLILAAAYPNLQITAIDSNQKKCAFVTTAAEKLALHNLRVVAGRARELNRQPQWQGKFAIITARAVAEAATIFRETKNMLANDGKFIFYKTPQQVIGDLPQLEKFSKKYNFTWKTTEIYTLPGGDGQRQFIFSATL